MMVKLLAATLVLFAGTLAADGSPSPPEVSSDADQNLVLTSGGDDVQFVRQRRETVTAFGLQESIENATRLATEALATALAASGSASTSPYDGSSEIWRWARREGNTAPDLGLHSLPNDQMTVEFHARGLVPLSPFYRVRLTNVLNEEETVVSDGGEIECLVTPTNDAHTCNVNTNRDQILKVQLPKWPFAIDGDSVSTKMTLLDNVLPIPTKAPEEFQRFKFTRPMWVSFSIGDGRKTVHLDGRDSMGENTIRLQGSFDTTLAHRITFRKNSISMSATGVIVEKDGIVATMPHWPAEPSSSTQTVEIKVWTGPTGDEQELAFKGKAVDSKLDYTMTCHEDEAEYDKVTGTCGASQYSNCQHAYDSGERTDAEFEICTTEESCWNVWCKFDESTSKGMALVVHSMTSGFSISDWEQEAPAVLNGWNKGDPSLKYATPDAIGWAGIAFWRAMYIADQARGVTTYMVYDCEEDEVAAWKATGEHYTGQESMVIGSEAEGYTLTIGVEGGKSAFSSDSQGKKLSYKNMDQDTWDEANCATRCADRGDCDTHWAFEGAGWGWHANCHAGAFNTPRKPACWWAAETYGEKIQVEDVKIWIHSPY